MCYVNDLTGNIYIYIEYIFWGIDLLNEEEEVNRMCENFEKLINNFAQDFTAENLFPKSFLFIIWPRGVLSLSTGQSSTDSLRGFH